LQGGENMVDQPQPTTNQPLQIQPDIRAFLESILDDAGMKTLEQDMREEMVRELFARLDQYITAVITQSLPPQYLDDFIKISDEKKSMAEIQQFLKDKLTNPEEVFTKAFADFRSMYLSNVTLARMAPDDNTLKPENKPVQNTN